MHGSSNHIVLCVPCASPRERYRALPHHEILVSKGHRSEWNSIQERAEREFAQKLAAVLENWKDTFESGAADSCRAFE